jgi:hypothetical protein
MRRRHTAYAALLLAAALLAATAPARAELPDLAPCAAPAARQPIIEPGRERQIRALFAPHQAGAPLTDAPGAPIFRAIRTQHDAIDALLEAPDGRPLGALRLRARACEPDAPRTTASFALTLLAPEAAPDAERLAAAVTANDPGDFYSAFAAAPPSPAAAAAATAQLAAAPPEPAAPFNASQLALAVILALAALTLLLDAPALRRDLGLTGRPGLLTAAALAALTAAALALRLAADPTFLREAYALPNVHALTSPIRWQSPITDYPQGSDLMTALIGPLLAENPYDAWFLAHVTYGTLTVLAAYALGTALTSRRRTGLITAALFALWPHHIRFSASESTHVAFVLWATVALALAALAARNGRLRTFAALTATTAAAVITRPEAALFVPACALLALSHGPGVRRRLLSPPRLAIVAAAAYLHRPDPPHHPRGPQHPELRPDRPPRRSPEPAHPHPPRHRPRHPLERQRLLRPRHHPAVAVAPDHPRRPRRLPRRPARRRPGPVPAGADLPRPLRPHGRQHHRLALEPLPPLGPPRRRRAQCHRPRDRPHPRPPLAASPRRLIAAATAVAPSAQRSTGPPSARSPWTGSASSPGPSTSAAASPRSSRPPPASCCPTTAAASAISRPAPSPPP